MIKNLILAILIGTLGFSIVARLDNGVKIVRPATVGANETRATPTQPAVQMELTYFVPPTVPPGTFEPAATPGRMCTGAECPPVKPPITFPLTETPTE